MASNASARRKPTAAERAVAGTLIAGAFGLIGLAIFATAAVFDKVERGALINGYILTSLSVVLFLGSIGAGGKGMTGTVKPGPLNIFAFQVWLGIFGILALIAAGALFALNIDMPDRERDRSELNVRLLRIENGLARQQQRIDGLVRQATSNPECGAPRLTGRSTGGTLRQTERACLSGRQSGGTVTVTKGQR